MKQTLSTFATVAASLTVLSSFTFLQANPEANPETGVEAEVEAEALDSVRFSELGDGTGQLQTGTTRFQKGSVTIDLVGVIHIGDKAYYEELNRKLSGYDVVLYEMVGGPVQNRNERKVEPELGMIHIMQRVVQNAIGLQHQMSSIDYSRPNFVHADATQKQFDQLLSSRNESMLSLLLKSWQMENSAEMEKYMEKIGGEELSAKMAEAVTEMNPAKFKRSMAPLLANSEEFLQKMSGDMGTILIEERNKIVMDKIAEQTGLGHKNIAVFYGAGHMPDFKIRLEAEGFTEQATEWDVAWNIGSNEAPIDALGFVGGLLQDEELMDSVMSIFRSMSEK